jgi:putative transposase
VLTARTEVTDRVLTFGVRHLRLVLPATRPTTTGGAPIAAGNSGRPGPTTLSPTLSHERIKRRSVLGGLINEYERAA